MALLLKKSVSVIERLFLHIQDNQHEAPSSLIFGNQILRVPSL